METNKGLAFQFIWVHFCYYKMATFLSLWRRTLWLLFAPKLCYISCQFNLNTCCGSIKERVEDESHRYPLFLERTSFARLAMQRIFGQNICLCVMFLTILLLILGYLCFMCYSYVAFAMKKNVYKAMVWWVWLSLSLVIMLLASLSHVKFRGMKKMCQIRTSIEKNSIFETI